MIDFRYHVVSLIAVFIALAVGIVLGAGPLRGKLSDTLEGQVAELGAERNDLREQVQLNDRRAQAKDELIASLSTSVTAGVLDGAAVAVVGLPGGDADLVDDLAGSLLDGGAQSVTRVEVEPSWEDDGARAELVAELAEDLGTQDDPAQVLAAVLAGSDASGSSPEARSAATRLEQAELISVQVTGGSLDQGLPGAVDLPAQEVVVLVGGGLGGQRPAQPDPASRLQGRLDLVRALVETDVALCVFGAGTETWQDRAADAEDLIVAAVRADGELAVEVSTVDNLESAAGQLSATWAAAWALQGDVGHYGLAADADEAAPASPSARDSQGESLGPAGDPARSRQELDSSGSESVAP
ncbi:MAG: copper transporter [Actinobacteria bacterium]|nr:copper transporter [Actinomycetota bacterium]